MPKSDLIACAIREMVSDMLFLFYSNVHDLQLRNVQDPIEETLYYGCGFASWLGSIIYYFRHLSMTWPRKSVNVVCDGWRNIRFRGSRAIAIPVAGQ